MNTSHLKSYFYAEDDVDIYDATVRLTTEPYDQLHAQVCRLVAFWKSINCYAPHIRPLIVDIGSGTGMEALGVLKEVGDVDLLCIDLSDRMLDVLGRKLAEMFGDPTGAGRCRMVQADVRNNDWMTEALAAAGFSNRQISLAISVYTLHHLTPGDKEKVYRSIANSLQPGGTFICGDLYSFRTPSLAEFAQTLEENWITSAFESCADSAALGRDNVKRLMEAWLRHSRYENKPLPINAIERPSDRCSDPGVEQMLLIRAGFKSVEVPFRIFQNGIIWAEV
jgi:SAM-dependent methyltransferase